MDFCLIIPIEDILIPELTDDNLFYHFKSVLISQIIESEIHYFGYAPDNTADNQDDLLIDGFFFRIICPEYKINVDLDSNSSEVKKEFISLIENHNPFWSSVIIERGFIKTETTIEFLYK